jgi:SEC-C motif-containing protein
MRFEELTLDLTAEELIQLRFVALQEHNFSLLYASYHPQAPFLEQFPNVLIYLDFAEHSLSDLHIHEMRTGGSRATAEGVELICKVQFELGGEHQTLYELALLKPTAEGWRYHSAQKLTAEEFQGDFEALDFIHFDHQESKVRF